MKMLAHWLVRYRFPLLALFVLLSILSVPLAWNVSYDRSIDSFFDPGHPMLKAYHEAEAEFGGDSVCVAVYEDPHLLSRLGMERLQELTRRLLRIDGVQSVKSLADLRRPSMAIQSKTLLDWFASDRATPEELSDEILDTYMYVNQFVGADRKTAASVVLLSKEAMHSGKIEETIASIRATLAEPPYQGELVGAPVLVNDFFDKIEEDAWTLTTVSVATMALVILILFRNIRWVLLPLAIVFATWSWMRGGVAIFGLELGFTAAMTTALISVIGIATTIHIAVRYREVSESGYDPVEAMEIATQQVLPAVFWTCATTAMGFGSLLISKVAPVRDFGLVMALVSMLVGIACFLALPGGVLLGRGSTVPEQAPGEKELAQGLALVESLVLKYSWLTASAAVGCIVIAGIGMLWLIPETDFTKNFRGNSPVLKGYQFAEDRLEGAGLMGLAFDAPHPLTPEFLAKVREAEGELRSLPGVTKVIGLTDFMDFARNSLPAMLRAETPVTINLALRTLRKEMPDEIAQVWNDAQNRMRIVLRVQERQTAQGKGLLLEQVEAIGREHFGASPKTVGLYVLLVYLMDSLLSDQWLTFGAAAVGALVMLSVAFRSFRLGVCAFIPNLIPIIGVVGMMGWIGLKVNAATAMIQSIAMGLAVDFSIHYVYRVAHETRNGVPFHEALANTHMSTGKAMVFASLALMLGFGVLVFSNFLPTMQFGLLVSLAMAGGLVGNLVLLPVLLTWLCPARLKAVSPTNGLVS